MKSKIVSKDSIFNTLNVGESTPVSTLYNTFNPKSDYIELHISDSEGTLLKSHLNYNRYSLSKDTGFKNGTFESVDIDPIDDLSYYGYVSGRYTVQYNFLRKIFNTTLDKSFFVKEISPSRKEVRLASNTLSSKNIQENFTRIVTKLQSLSYVYNLILNLGSNNLAQIINVSLDTSETNFSILVKLDDPLSSDVNLSSLCWIVESISLSTKYVIDLVSTVEVSDTVKIQGPNFNLSVNDSNSYDTQFMSTSDLIEREAGAITGNQIFNSAFGDGYSNLVTLTNKTQLVLSKLMKDKNSIDINVDYSKFKDFVHFSSIEDRINNFVSKLKQIEDIDSILSNLKTLPESTQVNVDIDKYYKQKLDILSLFDGYEHFLYFDILPGYSAPKEDGLLPSLLYTTDSIQFQLWYSEITEQARIYDLNNPDYVWHILPAYIKDDLENEKLKLFINGLGHYYDNIWIYIKSLENVYVNTNNLNTGISKDLVKEMLVSFGIKLYNTSEEVTIDQDIVGNNSGLLEIGNLDIVATQDYTQELYKRLYHNLPLLLKSKGTERSVRTLLSIYGIPSEILSIDKKLSSFASNTPTETSEDVLFTKVGNLFGNVHVPWNVETKTIQFDALITESTQLLIYDAGTFKIDVTVSTNTLLVTVNAFGQQLVLNNIKKSYNDQYKIFVTQFDDKLYLYVHNGFSLLTTNVALNDSSWNDLTNNSYFILGSTTGTSTAGINNFRFYKSVSTTQIIHAHASNPKNTKGLNDGDLLVNISLGLDNIIHPYLLSKQSAGATPTYNTVLSYYDLNKVQYKPFSTGITFSVVYSKLLNASGNTVAVYIAKNPNSLFSDETKDARSTKYAAAAIKYFTKNENNISVVSNLDNSVLLSDIKQNTHEVQDSILDVSLSRGKDLNKQITDYLHSEDINSYFGVPDDMYEEQYSGAAVLRNKFFKNNIFKYTYTDYIKLSKYINTSLFKMIEDYAPVGIDVITGVSVHPALTDRNKYQYKRSKNKLDQIVEVKIGNIDVSAEFNKNIQVDFDGTEIHEKVGYNKFISNKVFSEDEFNRSPENVLYGNIRLNTEYKFNHSQKGEFKLYKITNHYIKSQYPVVTSFPSKTPTAIQIFPGLPKYVCSSTYPQVIKTKLNSGASNLIIEVINKYNCAMEEPEPTDDRRIEFQEYYVDLKSFTLPRYDGSKLQNKEINNWNVGDSSYGKAAAINSYVNHTALFTRIYSGSIGANYHNVTLKYLVDKAGNFTELNELNRNIFDVQNIIKQNDNCTVSLFDSLKFGNQKGTNGIKPVFSSGYYYKPMLYTNSADTEIDFIKEAESQLSKFTVSNSGGFIKSTIADQQIKYPPVLVGNEYYLFNAFDTIDYNSFNSFDPGDIEKKIFPSYEIIDGSVKYTFVANFVIEAGFLNTVPTQYRFDIVHQTGETQDFSDRIIASELVTLQAGYSMRSEPRLQNSRINGNWNTGLTVELNQPAFDDVNNKQLPQGSYTCYSIPSEFVLTEADPQWELYKKHIFYFITYGGRFYYTGIATMEQDIFGRTKAKVNSLQYRTIQRRTISIKTQVLTDLTIASHVYFRLAKLDANPVAYEALAPGGKLYVEVESDATLKANSDIIYEILDSNRIVLNTSVSAYYGYTQVSSNEELISKYGQIETEFKIYPEDIISIKHPDSTKSYLYRVLEASTMSPPNELVVIKVDSPVAANIINEPSSVSEIIIFRRVLDETNVVLQFSKKEGDTSYGLIIPKNINPTYMDNINTVISEINKKLLN